MKRFLLALLFGLFACTLPQVTIATPTAEVVPTATFMPTKAPQPTLPPGSAQNPLILALTPSPHPADDVIESGKQLALKLEALTGYHIVSAIQASEADLLRALALGNAHIASLSPLAYAYGYRNDDLRAALASTRNGDAFYGAQFIVNARDRYKFYFDPVTAQNTADAAEALYQFKDKKPCWSDMNSLSGYVIPLGVLNQAKVPTQPGAFVAGQPTVVRAVYAGGICDFGATYIDARDHPSLEAGYPDVKERVKVVWRIPKVIPYDVIVLSKNVPADAERSLLRAFVDLMSLPEGKALMQKVYGIDELQIVQDAVYEEFRACVNASGVSLDQWVK
jgi:ABC-type phosphate/phosphonate transport system substrate-binding protein